MPGVRMRAMPRSFLQRGFSLLETSIIVAVIGAVVAAGFLLLQARKPAQQVLGQEQALQWADQALAAYAARHARLPCPVSTPTGAESDCVGPNQKGWLPVNTLRGVHPGGDGALPPMRYMAFGGDASETDLLLAQNQFNPKKWDGEPHDFAAINGLDFCAVLHNAARESASGTLTDRARSTDIHGNAVNVAYAISVAGANPGRNGLFDGINQTATAEMESPARANNADYDDRVRVRDFQGLARTLGCEYAIAGTPDGVALASLDMLALAVDVSDEVDAQNAALVEQTQAAVGMAAASEVFAILNVALAAASISNSVSTLATGSAQLATAVATCPVPPFITCGLIPPYTAAVTAASVAIGFASAATALAAAALAASSAGLALTVEARDMAKEAAGKGPADIAGLAEKACLASDGGYTDKVIDADGNLITVDPPVWKDGLKQEVTQLEQKLQQTIADRDAAQAKLNQLSQIPSPLIDYPPHPVRNSWWHCVTDSVGTTSCHVDYEPIADYNQRVSAWHAQRQQMEATLQTKLAAIRSAEQAYFDWETTEVLVKHAKTQYDQMGDAIDQLRTEVQQCDASPPTDTVGVERCKSNRNALEGMTTCSLDVLTAQQVAERQCLAWKQEDHETAKANERSAWLNYQQKLGSALFLPSPPIANYMTDPNQPPSGWHCGNPFAACNVLIINGQHRNENDKREPYAMTYYKLLGLKKAVEKQTDELEKKREAYATAKAQCDTLTQLSTSGTTGGAKVPLWQGAEAILNGANCKGANGPVNPASCLVPAGGTP